MAWLGMALRRCFEAATTREWSRPEGGALLDEGWLRRWLTSTAHEGSQRPPGEQMLPWLYELFAPERPGVPPEPCMPTVLVSDSPGAERLLSAPAAYMLACSVGAPRLRSGWRRLFNLATEGRSFHRLLHCIQLQGERRSSDRMLRVLPRACLSVVFVLSRPHDHPLPRHERRPVRRLRG